MSEGTHSQSAAPYRAYNISAFARRPDIQVGISYWVTQNLKAGASYRLDALINVQNQRDPAVANLLPDRYTTARG